MSKRFLSIVIAALFLFSSLMAIIPFSAFAQNELVISECNTTSGWTKINAPQNPLNVTSERAQAQSDNGAIAANTGHGFFQVYYQLPDAIDVSGYSAIEWDACFTGTGGWAAIQNAYSQSGYVRIFSNGGDPTNTGSNSLIYRFDALQITDINGIWVHIKAPIDKPTINRNFDAKALTAFRFYTSENTFSNDVPDGVVRLDNIKATGESTTPEPPPTPGTDVVITNCETAAGWTKVNSAANNPISVTTEAAQAQSDDGAIAANSGHGFFQAYYVLPSAVDISGCDTIEWDACFTGTGGWSAIQEAYKELGYVRFFSNGGSPTDTGSNSLIFRFDALEITDINGSWVHVKAPLSAPTINRNFDAKALTAFRFYTSESSFVNTVPDGAIRLDNVKAVKSQQVIGEGVFPIPGKFSKTTTGSFSFESKDFTHDLSAYQKSDLYLTMDVTVENTDGTNNVMDLTKDGQIELTSSGKSDVQELNWSLPRVSLKSGLNKVRLSLADANTVASSTFDLSNVNYFRFYSQKNGDSVFNVTIENIVITTQKEERIVSTYFSDGMMFKQNSPMNIFGNVKEANKNIKAELFKNSVSVETKTCVSGENGDWKLAFDGRAGSYDVYKIEIYVDDKPETTINDIAVGELWLASGQSNMEYVVGQAINDDEYAGLINTNVRFFAEPTVPGGVNSALPAVPATDIEGARWANGGNPVDFKYVSAIGYMMSLKLQSQLDVPVGFINTAKGASVIESWLPRETVENNDVIKSTLQKRGIYYTEDVLSGTKENWQYLTTLYNTKIAPLAGINISGLLWYQGESNIKYADEDGYNTFYKNALEDMLEAYSDLFGFERGKMPFICAHLAPYNNSHIRANDFMTIQADFADVLNDVAASGKSRMLNIPIYDLPLTYKDPPVKDFDPIHPNSKAQVANRFANAALAAFYGIGNADASTAPTVSSMSVNGNKVVLTFKNVGTGLTVLGGGKTLHGFAIADSSRVFTGATAKITSANTVEVYSDSVTSPVAVTYAWNSFNMLSNLANSMGIPAIPYRSDKVKSTYYLGMDWGYFDSDTLWNPLKSNDSGFENAYTVSENATLSFNSEGCVEGEAHAKLDMAGTEATLSPVLTLATSVKPVNAYSGITVYVKNGSANNAKVSMKLVSEDEVYYPSVITGDKLDSKYAISSEYKPYTFNFARVINSDGKVLSDSSVVLKTISDIHFVVEGSAGTTVYFDNAYLRTDKLPTPGSESDDIVEPDEDTTPGALDKDGNMWLSGAETADKWSASNAQIVFDKENHTQGKASVGTKGAGGVLKQIAYAPGVSLDVSAYQYLEFDVYFSNMKWFGNKDIVFEITSSGGPDNESNRYMYSYIKNNAEDLFAAGDSRSNKAAWYHVKLDLDNPQTAPRGGLNKKSFNYFRFFTLTTTEDPVDFDIRFDNMKFTKDAGYTPQDPDVGYGDPSYGVKIDDSSMWMTTAENSIWWRATGTTVELDSKVITEGKSSVGAAAKDGVLKQIAYVPGNAIDVSAYQYLEFDVYFSNMKWFGNKDIMFEVTSSGGPDNESNRYMYSYLKSNAEDLFDAGENRSSKPDWYHVKLDLNNPQAIARGGFNKKSFNFFRFFTQSPTESPVDFEVRFDNMKFTKGADSGSSGGYGDPSYGVVADKKSMWMSTAENTIWWKATGTSAELDGKNKTEGDSSVGVTAKNGVLKQLAFVPDRSIDVSEYQYLEFDVYFSNMKWFGNKDIMFEITSSGGPDNESNRYMYSYLKNGAEELFAAGESRSNKPAWYHVKLDLNNPQAIARGGLNKKNFSFFRFFTLNPTEKAVDFDIRFDNMKFTKGADGGSSGGYGDPAYGVKADKKTTWMSTAENTIWWKATGASVELDRKNKTEGKSSVGVTAKDGVLKQLAFTPDRSIDVSEYQYLEFDVYFSNMKWFGNKDIMFEITSSGGPDNESNRYMYSYLKNGSEELFDAGEGRSNKPAWYHVKLDLNNPQAIARGGFDKKNFNFFRFFTLNPTEKPADFDIRFDNMKFTKGTESGSSGGYGDHSYGVVIDDSSMWMSTAENTIWWKATGTGVANDKKVKTQGASSVTVEAKNGVLKQLAFVPDHAIDISAYQYLEFDAFFSNLDWLRDCGGIMFELTSSGTCDIESNRFTRSSILEASPAIAADYESGASGGKWYHFKLSLNSPHSKVRGGLNLKNFNYFRFYTVESLKTTSDYTLWFDNFKFTKGEAPAAVIRTPEKIVINSADSASLWTSPGQEVMLDTVNKVSGKGSVSVVAKGGILKELAYHPAEPIDLTGYKYLQFDLFLSDIRCLSTSTGFMVEVTSSGTCDVESNRFMKTAILAACPELAKDIAAEVKGNKWYHFCFDLTRPQNQARGGLNMSAMNFFRIYFLGSPEGTPDCKVNLDNLEVTVNGLTTQTASSGPIVFSPGGSSGKNVGNKVNMGLVSNKLTEIPGSLITTVIILGGLSAVAMFGILAVLIAFLSKKKKKATV